VHHAPTRGFPLVLVIYAVLCCAVLCCACCAVLCCAFALHAAVAVVGGGEGSGPLSPPDQLSEECFSAGEAAAAAYRTAALQPPDIDYWGLYDCFPICFIRLVRAALCLHVFCRQASDIRAGAGAV
jgi:hypothetical protein